ncbi:MAG: hypothetical protein K2X28_01390 [Alphaproteobacteria bacterium]|nr:hypothetical protein [Alphaproteobacteria bacterium]
MLNIIEPRDHHLHTSKISSLLNFLKIYQKFSLLPEEKEAATFIIAENEKFGVYGGAVVYLQDVKRLYHKLAAPLLEFLPKKEQIWCVRLCFNADQNDRVLILETLALCEDFYVNLYKILCALGQKKRTPYFALTLRTQDHQNTLNYGRWSYLLGISPYDSSDYHFHGLLALSSKKEGKDKISGTKFFREDVSDDGVDDEDTEEEFYLDDEDDLDDQDDDLQYQNLQNPTDRFVQ